jgi:hypothetical protein
MSGRYRVPASDRNTRTAAAAEDMRRGTHWFLMSGRCRVPASDRNTCTRPYPHLAKVSLGIAYFPPSRRLSLVPAHPLFMWFVCPSFVHRLYTRVTRGHTDGRNIPILLLLLLLLLLRGIGARILMMLMLRLRMMLSRLLHVHLCVDMTHSHSEKPLLYSIL